MTLSLKLFGTAIDYGHLLSQHCPPPPCTAKCDPIYDKNKTTICDQSNIENLCREHQQTLYKYCDLEKESKQIRSLWQNNNIQIANLFTNILISIGLRHITYRVVPGTSTQNETNTLTSIENIQNLKTIGMKRRCTFFGLRAILLVLNIVIMNNGVKHSKSEGPSLTGTNKADLFLLRYQPRYNKTQSELAALEHMCIGIQKQPNCSCKNIATNCKKIRDIIPQKNNLEKQNKNMKLRTTVSQEVVLAALWMINIAVLYCITVRSFKVDYSEITNVNR